MSTATDPNIGRAVRVPRLSNPARGWWVEILEVSDCRRFVLVGRADARGLKRFGRRRWVAVKDCTIRARKPLVLK